MGKMIAAAGVALGVTMALSTPAKAQLNSTTECTNQKSSSTNSFIPYRTSKFKDVIDNSLRLQWPTSSECLRDDRKTKYLKNRWFVTSSNRLRFNTPNRAFWNGDSSKTTRMELRGQNWRSKDTSGNKRYKTWKGSVHLPGYSDAGRAPRFSVGQLFADGTGDAMGIVFERNSSNRSKGKLRITTKYGNGFDLANFTSDSIRHNIRIVYDRTKQTANVYYSANNGSESRKGTLDFSELSSSQQMYWKAGFYICCNSNPGTARLEFSSLFFSGS